MKRVIKIKDAFAFLKKSKIKAGDGLEIGKYPFYTSSSVLCKYLDSYEIEGESLIFGTGGSASVHHSYGNFSTSTDCFVIQSNNKYEIDLRFVYLFLSGNIYILENGFKGAGLKHISKKYLEDVEIPLLPIERQKKIVEVLDKAQGLIDARKEQIRLMDELIQSVFYEMFGDPVTNPKGWETGTVNDLTLKTQYGTSKKAHETDGEYAMLRMNNISYTGGWDFSSLKYVDLDENELEKYLVYEGELLFNRTNSKELVGKTAVYRESKPMAYAGYLVKLITNTKGNTEYISAYLNSQHGKATLLNMAKSIVGMANINAEELKNIRINLPPIDVQNDFADIVSRIEKERKKLSESIRNYEDNYSSILQKAFAGKLF